MHYLHETTCYINQTWYNIILTWHWHEPDNAMEIPSTYNPSLVPKMFKYEIFEIKMNKTPQNVIYIQNISGRMNNFCLNYDIVLTTLPNLF